MKRNLTKIFVACALFGYFVIPFFVFADEDRDELKRQLEEQIAKKQAEIKEYQVNVEATRSEARTLENEIQILEDEIDIIRLEINQIDLSIQQSTLNIQEIDEQMVIIEEKIEASKDLLGEYIRIVAQYDQETLLEVVLKNNKFSDLFDEINAIESIQEGIHSVLDSVRELKDELSQRKDELENERAAQNQLKSLQLVQKRSVESKQWQKEDILEQTNGEERAFQEMISNAQKDIKHIREQLSLLDKYDLTLDDAVSYAIFAAAQTGIRPAFLLGVLEAESRLGLNTGTGNWEKDMYQCYMKLGYITRATKEKAAFLEICANLGLNPNTQPVSAEPWYGCGGAMGIAQFMPTTWLGYVDQVSAITGNLYPNPWKPQDAFIAAAIKLSQGGANQKTEIGERTAYAKYLAGGYYQKWLYNSVVTYVIDLAAEFQRQYFN